MREVGGAQLWPGLGGAALLRGLGGATSLAEALRRRAGLVLVVSEECPTSALALRRLAPLVASWGEAGLGALAVFEDPLEVALRVARRFGWRGEVLAEERPYELSRRLGLESLPTALLLDPGAGELGRVTGWDRPGIVELLGRARGASGVRGELEVPGEEAPLRKPGCSSKATLRPELIEAMVSAGGLDEMEEMFERGFTDGLPVVPPTRRRVEAMLAGRDPAASLGLVPPVMGEATLERVAACAVLAGCRPAYFPVVLAAVEAALDPAFNLHGQAVTTQPAGQLVIVNGPVRDEIGLNSGMGALGPGWRSNLTIGRALRLVVSLTGGGMPGALDRSTLGHSGKLSFCLAEAEEVSPWEPLHVERGYAISQSVVTVAGCDAPLSISDHRSKTPEELAHVLAWAAASQWSTYWWPMAEPSIFVVCPEHVEMFRGARWSKERLRETVFEELQRPAGELRRGETTPVVQRGDPGEIVHKWTSPESIVLVVAGGEAGRYSAVLGPCTGMGAQMISREVSR
ncbi:MAG TPA: hypothetical protein VMD59_01400 [Acidimicrobiales bacterium]|nr:hypothetical protein [Acidimicrobiales bacterium]